MVLVRRVARSAADVVTVARGGFGGSTAATGTGGETWGRVKSSVTQTAPLASTTPMPTLRSSGLTMFL